jgi:DHA2 family multidrug resistance protein
MPLSGLLTNRIQARYLLAFGLAIETFALWRLTGLNGDVSFAYAAQMRVWIAVGIPFLFVPLSNAAYVGLAPDKSSQASSMMSISRNLGGTLGISLVQTFLAQRQQFHQARLVEKLNPLNPAYDAGLQQIGQTLTGQGVAPADASHAALGALYAQVGKQAGVLSYIDVFWALAIFIGCMAPLVFFLKPPKAGASKPPEGASA